MEFLRRGGGGQRKSMQNFLKLIKNKVEFPRKNHVEFPGVLAFCFFPTGVTQLWKIFRGEALFCTAQNA